MERAKFDEFKEIIDDFFGEGMTDSILDIFNVAESDIVDDECDCDCNCECNCDDKCTCKKLPSEKIDNIEKKLQIHKIVQEYVSENNISNDDYAKLFEFACWVLTK